MQRKVVYAFWDMTLHALSILKHYFGFVFEFHLPKLQLLKCLCILFHFLLKIMIFIC